MRKLPGRDQLGGVRDRPTLRAIARSRSMLGPGTAGSAPAACGAPTPLTRVQDDRRAAWTTGAPGRVSSPLPITAPHRHGALVTQPGVVSTAGTALGAPSLGHTRRLPPGLPAPAVGSDLLGCHSSPPPPRPPNSQPHELSSSLGRVKQQIGLDRSPRFRPRSVFGWPRRGTSKIPSHPRHESPNSNDFRYFW